MKENRIAEGSFLSSSPTPHAFSLVRLKARCSRAWSWALSCSPLRGNGIELLSASDARIGVELEDLKTGTISVVREVFNTMSRPAIGVLFRPAIGSVLSAYVCLWWGDDAIPIIVERRAAPKHVSTLLSDQTIRAL